MGFEVYYTGKNTWDIWSTITMSIIKRNLRSPLDVAKFIVNYTGKDYTKTEKSKIMEIWIKAAKEAQKREEKLRKPGRYLG